MSDILQALFFGIVEGMTEFIPVSSTAHLLILTDLFRFSGPPGHVFEIFIQLGAILAVVVLYRKRFLDTALGLGRDPQARHFALLLIVGTIPALVAGALGRDFIKQTLYNPTVIGSALIVGGLIMLALERWGRTERIQNVEAIPLRLALIIGCCQAVALIPGVSRSGASIAGGLWAGLSRPLAAEFSFFLAVPVMCAAVFYDTLKSWDTITSGGYWDVMITGFVAAFLAAMVVIKFALAIVTRYGFTPFAIYRIAAGGLILLFMV